MSDEQDLGSIMAQLRQADSNGDHWFSRLEVATMIVKDWVNNHPDDRQLTKLSSYIANAVHGVITQEIDYPAWLNQMGDRAVARVNNVLDANRAARAGTEEAQSQTRLEQAERMGAADIGALLDDIGLSAADKNAVTQLIHQRLANPASASRGLANTDFPISLRDAYFADDRQFREALDSGQISDRNAIEKYNKRQQIREALQELTADFSQILDQQERSQPAMSPAVATIRAEMAKYGHVSEAPNATDFTQAVASVLASFKQR